MLTYQWGHTTVCWLMVAQQLRLCRIGQMQILRGMLIAYAPPILKLIRLQPFNFVLVPSLYDGSLREWQPALSRLGWSTCPLTVTVRTHTASRS